MNRFFTKGKSGLLCDVMSAKDKIESPYVRTSADRKEGGSPRPSGVKRADISSGGSKLRGRVRVVSMPWTPFAARSFLLIPPGLRARQRKALI